MASEQAKGNSKLPLLFPVLLVPHAKKEKYTWDLCSQIKSYWSTAIHVKTTAYLASKGPFSTNYRDTILTHEVSSNLMDFITGHVIFHQMLLPKLTNYPHWYQNFVWNFTMVILTYENYTISKVSGRWLLLQLDPFVISIYTLPEEQPITKQFCWMYPWIIFAVLKENYWPRLSKEN